MTHIILIVSLLVSIGSFLILCDILRVPFIKTSKSAKNLSKRQRNKTGTLEVWLRDFAVWVSRFIKLNEYKRLQLASDLQTAGMEVTPELHLARAAVKAGIIGLLAVPALYVFPMVTPLVLASAAAVYSKEVRSVQAKITRKREAINFELPRLVSTIDKTLEHNRDVLTILEGYKREAEPELAAELAVTVADMRSGNYESALTRLEARVGSPMMSDITRGLIGVLRGDETRLYWSALSAKFADIQRQTLKQKAQKVPGKVKRLSMFLLICFMLMYLVVIGMEVTSKLGIIFGGGM
jgi:Flp pilus assembly protein TadB